jgi:anti-anti-sigma factor
MSADSMRNEFAIEVVDEQSGGLRLRCTGELDIAAAPLVEEALHSIIDRRPASLVLDWSQLTFMDSTGIRLLLETLTLCRSANVDLTWTMSDVARRTLDLVGIHDALLREYASRTDTD